MTIDIDDDNDGTDRQAGGGDGDRTEYVAPWPSAAWRLSPGRRGVAAARGVSDW